MTGARDRSPATRERDTDAGPSAIPRPELTDGTVRVRPVADHDLDAVVAACQDPDIQRWTTVPSPYGREDAERFLRFSREGFATGEAAVCVIVDAADTELLGAVGVSIDRADLVGQVGYWVAPGARQAGAASRALRLLCRWVFDELGLGRMELYAAAGNAASNAVARSCGFQHEGVRRAGGISGHSGDPARPRIDMNLWGLLPAELPRA